MKKYKISELPVVEPDGRWAGLIDVTDMIGLDLGDSAES
jgi:CBS domain-containing protein